MFFLLQWIFFGWGGSRTENQKFLEGHKWSFLLKIINYSNQR